MRRLPTLTVLAVATSLALPVTLAQADTRPQLAKQGKALKVASAETAPPDIAYSLSSATRSEVVTIDPLTGTTKKLAASALELTANAWSVTTSRVYYSAEDLDSEAPPRVDSVPQAGGTPAAVIAQGSDLDISPDGTTYVFTGADDQLYKRAVSGGDAVRLTGAGGFKPRFSHDGTKIVFGRVLGENFDVYTLGINGTGLKRITASGAFDLPGAFSPDGKRLLFTRATGDDDVSVYAVNVDGTNLRRVAQDALDPDWAANGWIGYLAIDDRDTTQLAVLAPGIPGEETLLTDNGLDATAFRFERGVIAPEVT